MKKILIVIILLFFQTTLTHAALEVHDGATVEAKPPAFVPDDKTAIAIAKAVLIPIYGETFEQNRVQRPFSKINNFYAHLHGDTWIVENAPSARKKWTEPILRVEIDKTNGCILKVSDSY